MKVTIEKVVRDYLALRGESPGLLPLLEEGEEGAAVLTLADELRVKIPALAEKAAMETPAARAGEISSAEGALTVNKAGYATVRLPDDYLKLHSIRMDDWAEPLRRTEPEDSLRRALGANAPQWMICRQNPMVVEERDKEGLYLKIYGSSSTDRPAELLYIPRPLFDGEILTIGEAAYRRMLELAL